MCGICGFNWSDATLIRKVTKLMTHRGPDDKGFYVDNNISLGHVRLSIIDLKTGKQPIFNEDKSICVVLNGEIYNFKELRDFLEKKGHRFYTNSDTEVIVHLYEEYSESCVNFLNGMFAFAIWDSNYKKLFIARDRLGIKPIHYYFKDGKFIFASEIKSILGVGIKKEINSKYLPYILGFEFIPTPHSIFKNIIKLPPGYILILKDKKIRTKKYWDLKFSKTNKSISQIKIDILNGLKESVRKRLVSDVPVGAFLSGGIDSSSIAAFASELLDKPIQTFSLGYEDASYSEFEYAKQVSELFNTKHKELLIKNPSPEDFKKIIRYLDEPMTDTSVLPTYFFCKEARKHVKVCLSGEGGDEIFIGYDRFAASRMDTYYRLIPSFMRKKMLNSIILNINNSPQKKGVINELKRFIQGSNLPLEGKHIRWQYFLDENTSSNISKKGTEKIINNQFGYVIKLYHNCNSSNNLCKEQYIDLKGEMVDNVLVKSDRMSMANSLEVRVPFLDHQFVELTASIPPTLKFKRFEKKYILKQSLKNQLPRDILFRKKQGYSFPIKNWLRDKLKDYMVETLNNSEILKQYFNISFINKLIEQHLTMKQDHHHLLWALINIDLWYQEVFLK